MNELLFILLAIWILIISVHLSNKAHEAMRLRRETEEEEEEVMKQWKNSKS